MRESSDPIIDASVEWNHVISTSGHSALDLDGADFSIVEAFRVLLQPSLRKPISPMEPLQTSMLLFRCCPAVSRPLRFAAAGKSTASLRNFKKACVQMSSIKTTNRSESTRLVSTGERSDSARDKERERRSSSSVSDEDEEEEGGPIRTHGAKQEEKLESIIPLIFR